jgi:biopolymer transport protein ExbB
MFALLHAIIDHGGVTVFLIGLVSLASMTVAIERCWRLFPLQKKFRLVQEQARELLLRTGIRSALTSVGSDNAMARVLKAALELHERGAETMRAAALSAAQREVAALERGLGLIQIAAQIAPWLGLLGTVVGLMDVFASVGDKSNVTHAVAATGIYQALACTAAGLSVAIGAYVAYQLLSGLSSRLIDELESAAHDIAVYAAGAKP